MFSLLEVLPSHIPGSQSATPFRSLRRLILFSFVFLVATFASSQVAPTMGITPFQLSHSYKYDSINLYDAGVSIDIPVVNKPGVMPFKFDLIQESDAASPLVGVYSHQVTVSNSGYEVYDDNKGNIFYAPFNRLLFIGTNCIGNTLYPITYHGLEENSFIVITDASGAQHIVWAPGSTLANPIPFTLCAPSGQSATGTGITLDSSGYMISLTVNAVTGIVSYIVTDTIHGFTISNPNAMPLLTKPSTITITIQDRNGNKTTETTTYPAAYPVGGELVTQWVDPTGATVMTVTSPFWSTPDISVPGCYMSNVCPHGYYPTTYSYTDGTNTKQYSLNFDVWSWVPQPNTSAILTIPLPSSVTLPDNSSFQFTYVPAANNNVTAGGTLSSMKTPEGETIYYNKGPSTAICGSNYWELDRIDGDGTWKFAVGCPSIVVSPSGDWTYTFYSYAASKAVLPEPTSIVHPDPALFVPVPTQSDVYSRNSTLLREEHFCYNGMYETNHSCAPPASGSSQGCAMPWIPFVTYNPTGGTGTYSQSFCYPVLIQDIYTYAGSPKGPSLSELTYDGILERQLENKQYDFGATIPPSGTPLSDTVYQWGTYNNSTGACSAISFTINDRVCFAQVKDGLGNVLTRTNNSYDSTGNLLSIGQLVSGTTYLTTGYSYNNNGTLKTSTDVNAAVTSVTNGDCSGTLPTNVTMGILSESFVWNCFTAKVVSDSDDSNHAVTQFGYTDPLLRLTSVTDTLNNITNYSYGMGGSYTESSLLFNNGGSGVDVRTTMDTLGRASVRQTAQGPGSGNYDTVSYSYDPNGRLSFSSLPCVQTAWGAPCTGPNGTTLSYDAMSRPTIAANTAQPTPGQVSQSYIQNDVLTTLSPAATNESNKRRQLEYDGLGRLVSVCELTSTANGGTPCGQSSSATGYLTRYNYDAAGRLIGVCQHTTQPIAVDCTTTPSAGQQTRLYAYDGLGRLTSETNPETGRTTYAYDSTGTDSCTSGSRTSNGDLLRKTDANGDYQCFVYDPFHRLTDVGFGGPDPGHCKRFRYDNTGGVLATIPSGISVRNVFGRLVEAETDTCAWPITQSSIITDEWFGYTPRGELSDVYESTPNSAGYYHITASYWANGALNTLGGVPGQSSWSFGVDGEGRPNSATFGTLSWVKSASYYPSAPQTTITYGNKDTDVYGYDPHTGRMNSFTFTVGATPKTLTGNLGWNPNDTLGTLGIVDQFNPSNSQNCSYTYDDFARLAGKDATGYSVNCGSGGWQQLITLDAFGNISKSGTSSFQASYLLPDGTTNNKEQSVGTCVPTYDGRGNLTKDCTNNYLYAWDVYGNPASLQGMSLTFDALDREVQIGTTKEVLYSPLGKLGIMNGQSASTIRIPVPGGSTAELAGAAAGSKYILHGDWLGTSRLSTTFSNRSLAYDTAYAPYGESYASSGTRSADKSFTGQFQDTVSGLYDFSRREYNPVQGRWISPDPAGLGATDPTSPQTWNRYAYLNNNPLSTIDPTGQAGCGADGSDASDGGGPDACVDFIYWGDTGTIASNTYDSSGALLGTDSFNPWGNSMAMAVFTNPVLGQAGRTMNTVTAVYGAGFAGGGAFAVGGALGLGTAARSLYLVYGVPLVTATACAELCSGMSPFPSAESAPASAFAGAESGLPPTTSVAANLGRKLDFLLGEATGSQHNIDRSLSLARQLGRIGLSDSSATRQYLTEQLNQVLLDSTNIVEVQANGRFVRESLLMGPLGGVRLTTIWDGVKLITAGINTDLK